MRGGATSKSRGLITVLAALSLLGDFAAPSSGYPRPGRTELVSVTPDGTPGNNAGLYGHWFSSINASGRFIALAVTATTLFLMISTLFLMIST